MQTEGGLQCSFQPAQRGTSAHLSVRRGDVGVDFHQPWEWSGRQDRDEELGGRAWRCRTEPTILYTLKTCETSATIPTAGSQAEIVGLEDLSFTVWDVRGIHSDSGTIGPIQIVKNDHRERIESARTQQVVDRGQDAWCGGARSAMTAGETTKNLGQRNLRRRQS